MEQLQSTAINPNLERVIKSFQTTAMRSLQGPGPGGLPTLMSDMVANVEEYRKALAKKLPKENDFDPIHGPPPFPIQQMPVFTPVDASRSEKTDTVLEGEFISCFGVGGEKRLCLPQILNTVLRDFSLQQINAICDELHIFCSRCNHEQLHLLKMTGVLPLSAPSCGLITKTDAERLCNALLHKSDDKPVGFATPDSFKVYHECFGKCKGILSPEKYTSSNASCIQCTDCLVLFSPQKFVCHAHKSLENRTCHWGFDSANWRSYLLLAKDQEVTSLQEILEQIKSRFDSSVNKYKRKQPTGRDSVEAKRSKSEEGSPVGSWEDTASLRGISAFQPWSPGVLNALKEGKILPAPPAIMREGLTGILPAYLQTGPPVLLHPERVVPHTESSRYERHFAPNVSLAPNSNKVAKSDGEDDVSENSLPSTVKAEDQSVSGTSKDYKEWDLPTESDDSSLALSDDEPGQSSTPFKSTLEKEMDMIQKAMDGQVASSSESREAFLNEFTKLHIKHEELLNNAINAKKTLKEEIAMLKSFKKVATQKSRNLEKKLDQVRLESECRVQEAHNDKEKLLKEIKIHQSREDEETCKYIQMNRELQTRLQHYEIMYDQVCRENSLMREELLRLGINITELASKHKYNGSYGHIKTPPKSPHSHSPQSGRSPNHNHSLVSFARTSLAFAQSAAYGLKHERDT